MDFEKEYKCPIAGKLCYYWRAISGTQCEGNRCCHYLLDEGHSRKKGKNGKCLSHRAPDKNRKRKGWDMPDPTDKTTLDGYKVSERWY